MSDTTPPAFDLNKGIYFPQLTETFKISESELYDYYSTNSGMFPKNPGGGSGGGGGDVSDLSKKVANIEDKLSGQADAAEESQNLLSGYIDGNQISDVQDIIDNQNKLRNAQNNFYSAVK